MADLKAGWWAVSKAEPRVDKRAEPRVDKRADKRVGKWDPRMADLKVEMWVREKVEMMD